jgi:hypothetical protein
MRHNEDKMNCKGAPQDGRLKQARGKLKEEQDQADGKKPIEAKALRQ